MQLRWGTAGQLSFADEEEYYTALGIFANPDLARVYIEDNATRGSYTDAYRILVYADTRRADLPEGVKRAMKHSGRINCNPYVENLVENHGFAVTGTVVSASLQDVLRTIPETEGKNIAAFMKGYHIFQNEDPVDVKEITYLAKGVDVTEGRLVKKEASALERRRVPEASGKKLGKRDYIKAAIDDYQIGEAGEKLVYQYEKEKLARALREGKLADLEGKLEWVSRTDDSAGFDILSYDVEKGEPMYIEVKTTTGGAGTPFFMSANEVNTSKKLKGRYYIYRLYKMDRDKANQVEFYVLNGDVTDSPDLCLEAQGYRVTKR